MEKAKVVKYIYSMIKPMFFNISSIDLSDGTEKEDVIKHIPDITDRTDIILSMENIIKNNKVFRYVYKYKMIMKRCNHSLDVQIEKIISVLESEDYETRKQFVEGICIFLDIQDTSGAMGILDEHLFEEIIVPVFAVEYKKDNEKFIKWIGQCQDLFLCGKDKSKRYLLKQIDDFDTDSSFELVEYFCGKSFMLDKNQRTLDIIMDSEKWEAVLLSIDSSDCVHHSDKYFEYLKSFVDRMERCKEYCKISGNDKWDTLLADWEMLVTHLYKYEEYVRNNDYITFVDYKKKIGVNIDYGIL